VEELERIEQIQYLHKGERSKRVGIEVVPISWDWWNRQVEIR